METGEGGKEEIKQAGEIEVEQVKESGSQGRNRKKTQEENQKIET